MTPKAHFYPLSRIWFRLALLLIFSSTIAVAVHGQTATYHLHAENSAGINQLKTAGPDAASSTLTSINLKNLANGDYIIGQFATLSGVPNAAGIIPAGSAVSVSLWLRKSSAQGTMFPRVKVSLNTANGTSVCILTGSTALTTTFTKYTLTGTVPSNVSMSTGDRFYLWAGISLTAKSSQNNQAELNIEGTLNGNYDSLLTLPLPVQPPTINSLSPNVGPVGTSVTVAGSGFGATQGTSTVTFNGTSATPTSWTSTTIVVPVPAGASSGPVVVSVSGQNSNGSTFTVSPKIDSVAPTSGLVGSGVTITGSNFGATQGSSTVTFNGTAATPTSWSNAIISVPVPAGSTTGPVVVTAAGQASNGVTFTVIANGAIAGTITRTSTGTPINGALVEAVQGGVVKASTTSAANGNYTLANVQVGTYDVRVSAIWYQTSIQNGVVVTANATTTVNQSLTASATGDVEYVYDEIGRLVGVITPAERVTYTYDDVGNLLSISRGSSSEVSIIEFTPNNGPAGTTVTIYGTAFSTTPTQNTVAFNGVAATVTSATATQIVTQVPANATTGPISVTTPAGTAASSTSFIVGNPSGPTITGFTPTIGAAGTSVTITGTNFDPSASVNRVQFNQTLAAVIASTDTTITTSVPAASGSGRITVTTPEGSGTSSADFFIPPSPYTVGEVEVMSRMTFGQSQVVSFPNPNKIAIVVFDGVPGQWVSLGMTDTTISASGCCASSTVAIYKPDGTTLLGTFTFFQGGGGTPSVQLPVAGTYAIVVKPYSTLTGSVTLHLWEDLSPPIGINGPAVTLTNGPGQNERLLFSGNAGQWISVAVTDTTIGAANCCLTSMLSILKPDGTTLLAPIQFFQSGTATTSLQLPVSGTYSIFVDPYNAVAGNVTITLSEDLSPPISIDGPPVTLTTRIGQNARLFFSGTAGQWIGLGASDTNLGAPGCCNTTTMAIYNPDGTTLVAPVGWFAFQPGGGTPPAQLPATGTYTIVFDPYNTVAGNVTLTLSQDLSPPISINGPPVTLTNRPGQNARMVFNGNAGQWISLGLTDSTIGAPGCCNTSTIAIYKPDGTPFLGPTGFFGFHPITTTDSLQLPTSGQYTMVVDPYNGVAGNVTITLSEDLSPPISIDGPSVTLNFDRIGRNSRLYFSGNAGQRISLGLSNSTISAVGCCATSKVWIFNPDGTTLLENFGFFQRGGGTPTLQLPATGTYLIIVEPYDNMLGSVTLTLTQELAPPISINGAPVVLSNRPGQNTRMFFTGSAGQQVTLGVSPTNIGAPGCCLTSTTTILNPDGSILWGPMLIFDYGAASPQLQLPASGTYTLLVDPYDAVAGDVAIVLSEELQFQIFINGPPLSYNYNRVAQNASYFFSGSGGAQATVQLTGDIPGLSIQLIRPDGIVLAQTSANGSNFNLPTQILPMSGTYRIFIDPGNTNLGNLSVRVTTP
jgi:YD repeat-containing protein